jgi:hypothetical protein
MEGWALLPCGEEILLKAHASSHAHGHQEAKAQEVGEAPPAPGPLELWIPVGKSNKYNTYLHAARWLWGNEKGNQSWRCMLVCPSTVAIFQVLQRKHTCFVYVACDFESLLGEPQTHIFPWTLRYIQVGLGRAKLSHGLADQRGPGSCPACTHPGARKTGLQTPKATRRKSPAI